MTSHDGAYLLPDRLKPELDRVRLRWHGQTGASRTFLTHGEEQTMQQFAARLLKTRVEMPALHQSFEL